MSEETQEIEDFDDQEDLETQISAKLKVILTEVARSSFLSIFYGDYYIQYANVGDSSILWEVSSNAFLPSESHLTPEQNAELEGLGFTIDEEEPSNFAKTIEVSDDFSELDEIAKTTIEIFMHLFTLQYEDMSKQLQYELYIATRSPDLCDDICWQIKNAGLTAILVATRPKKLTFLGSLEEFFKLTKTLETKLALVTTQSLQEEDFQHPERVEDGKPKIIDLTELQPALVPFREHVGEIGSCDIAIKLFPAGSEWLAITVITSWWEEFFTLVREVEAKLAEENVQRESERESTTEAILVCADEFLEDPAFLHLPTQKAMIAYAIEHNPDFKTIPEVELRKKIQELNATIAAQGLKRRKKLAT